MAFVIRFRPIPDGSVGMRSMAGKTAPSDHRSPAERGPSSRMRAARHSRHRDARHPASAVTQDAEKAENHGRPKRGAWSRSVHHHQRAPSPVRPYERTAHSWSHSCPKNFCILRSQSS